jgi:hypothetical protein
MPIDATRMNDERGNTTSTGLGPLGRAVRRGNLLKTGFTGVWSLLISETLGPRARTGHFTCYDEAAHLAYFGHGLSADSRPLFDLWCLETLTYRWRPIPLTGSVLCGRSGTRGALVGRRIVLFGGYSEPNYFGDLHTIDVQTGEIQLIQTNGPEPSPRSTPIVAAHGGRLYVWGGFNGEWPSELSVLDFSDMTWRQYPQVVAGRTGVPWVIRDNFLYSYSGSKSGGLLVMDLETFRISVKETIGAEPQSAVMGAGMVGIGKYLIFYGGRANNDWTLMYACDVTTLWWFVFHVVPDGETVSLADGSVSESGLFMLPRLHSFGFCYEPQARQVIAFLGHPEKDPPPLFIVSCGEAMSVINLRDDMIAALKFGK